jgi:uncharacterized protein
MRIISAINHRRAIDPMRGSHRSSSGARMTRHRYIHSTLLLLAALWLFGADALAQREHTMKEGDTTYTLKQYFFCLLTKGPNRTQDSATAAEIQKGHMANINRLATERTLVMAGPFGDDGDWRGIFVFDVATKEEAERLVATDPAVQSGRLAAEIHPWWTAKGTVLP